MSKDASRSAPSPLSAAGGGSGPPDLGCPSWCVTDHGRLRGEEDQLHEGAPVRLADRTLARLVMSADPDTGRVDGPYVMIGETTCSPAEAALLGLTLAAFAQEEPPARREQAP